MVEVEQSNPETPTTGNAPAGGGRTPDEIALELMKFIAIATGYGKSAQSAAGFSGKPGGRSIEEQTDALLELYDKCRKAVRKEV